MSGMIYKAKHDFDITLDRSWLVGDKASDIHAGLSAGVKPILVLTGYGKEEQTLLGEGIINVADILEASSLIVSEYAQASV
jgi:D-glycero-D-manno-heptose 1,7-bisphosphate phosphatase